MRAAISAAPPPGGTSRRCRGTSSPAQASPASHQGPRLLRRRCRDGVQAHRISTDPVAGRQRTYLFALVRAGAVIQERQSRGDRSCRLDPSVRRHRVSADQAGTRGYGSDGTSGQWQVARLRPCPMSSVRDILKAALCPSTAHSRTSSASVRASGQQLLLAAPQPALPPPHSGCDPNAQSPCSADGAGLRRHAFSTRYTRNSTRDREAWRPCPTNSV